ncbi:DNA cytosine methyltransferase [Pseudomonas syringae]
MECRHFTSAAEESSSAAPKQLDVMQPHIRNTLQEILIVDLFSGAGGFSLGAIQAGLSVVGALEIDKNASKSYQTNIASKTKNEKILLNEDILYLDPADAMQHWGLEPGQCDIIVGGPPCQGFSTHRINNAGVGDPRNKLLGRYFEYVAALRPRIFLVENVPGLLWPRHKEYLEQFYEMGRLANYHIAEPVILNACDYGVMQNRRRVFILGIDNERPISLAWPPEPTHVSPALPESLRRGKQPWLPAKEAFRPASISDLNNVHMNHSKELIEVFKNTPINGGSRSQSGRILKCHTSHTGHKDVYGRIDPSKPAPTMTTACINPSKGRFVHPVENHGITVRQAARIQGFPEDFIFHGGLMASGAQIGNAVPIKLAEVLLKHISAGIIQEESAPLGSES